MTGRSAASAMGRGWLDAVHPDERDMIRGLTEHEFFSPSSRQFMLTGEGRHLRPDGTINWYFSQLVKEFNDSGEVTGYIGTLTDISDRKQAELELQKVSDRLALALNSGAIGCWEWDIQQNILVWDDRMYELYGYLKETNSHMPYEVWANAVHPDDLHTTETILQQAILGQLEFDYEFRVIHPDQSIHFIKAYGKVKRDSQGNAESMIGVNFDVSDRKQSETKLQLANEELKRATRLKDEFLANMSHELRTPLNSILGMNEGLQEGIFGHINERQIQVLQTIESSSTHLLTLINDILDVAKIESGQVTLELTATDLDSLCNSSLAFIKQQSLTKRIQLIPRIPKYLPEIMLDERRIRQVLINLLNNAVKFTLEGGTITLEVSQVQLESSTTNLTPLNYIKIAVIDTGIGISAENIQKLFQPFIQIDSALNRQYTGTGLGLALVKRLVELHGGTIELTSEVGVGSCFAINLPINIGDPAIEEQTEQDLSGESQIGQSQTEGLISPLILLAEDNEANIATFSSYLEAKGYRILLATDGQQVIDFAKAEQPDLILMDIQMPVIDGLEAIKQIRLDPNLVNIPIIALTALAMEGDRDRCLAAGANDYLSKPIKLKQLNLLIQQVLGSVK
jgi:PAS domain S-box-containing protein